MAAQGRLIFFTHNCIAKKVVTPGFGPIPFPLCSGYSDFTYLCLVWISLSSRNVAIMESKLPKQEGM